MSVIDVPNIDTKTSVEQVVHLMCVCVPNLYLSVKIFWLKCIENAAFLVTYIYHDRWRLIFLFPRSM